MLEKFFKLKGKQNRCEDRNHGRYYPFMTMAYILAVNPNILSAAGMDAHAVLIVTALAAFVGTAMMALFANYPFALAPRYGPECLFCLYRSTEYGIFLADRFDGGICRRYYIYHTFSYQCA